MVRIERDPAIASTRLHAMVTPDGWYLYPDNEEDAAWFAEHERAQPVHPAFIRAAGDEHVLCRLDPCGTAICRNS